MFHFISKDLFSLPYEFLKGLKKRIYSFDSAIKPNIHIKFFRKWYLLNNILIFHIKSIEKYNLGIKENHMYK